MIIIDRFEDDFAILETDNGHIHVEKNLLPVNAKEGDILIKTENTYLVDKVSTDKKRADIANRLRKLGL